MAATLVPLLGLLYGTVHKAVGNSLHSLTHPQLTTENPLIGIHPRKPKLYVHTKTCMRMFTAAVYVICTN